MKKKKDFTRTQRKKIQDKRKKEGKTFKCNAGQPQVPDRAKGFQRRNTGEEAVGAGLPSTS